jgi:hypothetical protein
VRDVGGLHDAGDESLVGALEPGTDDENADPF